MFLNTNARLLAALLLLAAAVAAALDHDAEARSAVPADAPEALLDATFAAHGGLDRFHAMRQMSYTLRDFPLSEQMARPNRSTVDLRTRRNRIDGEGFTVAYDGERAWATPHDDAAGLLSRFVTLGSFYFIGMPFVFGDAGAILADRGTATFRGKSYRVVGVRYESGVGHTSKDDYAVFIDRETDRLALIHHSVTENPDVDRVTWTFDDWQRVNGLLVPARMTFYPGWNPDAPGDGASFTIENVRFSTESPSDTLYVEPAD